MSTRDETVRNLEFIEQTGVGTDFAGQVKFSDGGFKMRDGAGEFDPRAGGGGLTHAQHQGLDTLIHDLAENNFTKIVRDANGRAQDVLVFVDNTEAVGIRDLSVTRDANGRVSQIVRRQRDAAGAVAVGQTMTGTVNRDTNGRVQDLSWVKS